MAAAGALFDQAVAVVLRSWSGLTMAVDNQFGGPLSQQKASWLETVTAQWMRENGTDETGNDRRYKRMRLNGMVSYTWGAIEMGLATHNVHMLNLRHMHVLLKYVVVKG